MTRRLTLIALLAASACAVYTPGPVSPPAPVPTPVPPIVEPVPVPPVPVPPVVGRRGPVRLEGRGFADDDGPFLGLGTSLFWALWGEKHAPDKLERNLAFLSGRVDYIRILGMVGTESWHDRKIDPWAHDYWDTVRALVARAARHGLRIQITVFADAQAMAPNWESRPPFLDRWVHFVNAHPERFTSIEIANEYWQNGLRLAELAALTKRANDATSVLVAPSAPGCGTFPEDETTDEQRACVEEWRLMLEHADLASPHFDRDTSKADGYDRPIRQPWEMLFGPRSLSRSYINNEPIGPQSSVAEDNDPGRLTMAAAVTWLTGGAAYTLHTGAGIRGGGAFDVARGRSADFESVPYILETLTRLNAARAVLPATLPNCPAYNANRNFENRLFDVDPDTLTRSYQARCGSIVVALPHGIRGDVAQLVARAPMTIDGVALEPGARLAVPAPARIIVGVIR